jgi:hypothetical protein
MPNQFILPPDLAPPSVKHLPLEKRIELWAGPVDACDAFLIAGLRNRVGPEGGWQAAYREWYEHSAQDHERAQIQFLENLSHPEAGGGN